MSVEAPNHIKLGADGVPVTTIQPNDTGLFSALFNQASNNIAVHPPESPKASTMWFEFHGASNQNKDAALETMSFLKQNALLKFSHVSDSQHQALTDVLNALKSTNKVKHLIIRQSQLQHHHLQTIGEVLKQNNGLAWLVLDHNKIDDRGVRHLADGLKENNTVKHVVLSHNMIQNEGAESMAHAILENSSIETLWLNQNHIGDEGIRRLLSAANKRGKMKVVDVSNNQTSYQEKQFILNNNEWNTRIYV